MVIPKDLLDLLTPEERAATLVNAALIEDDILKRVASILSVLPRTVLLHQVAVFICASCAHAGADPVEMSYRVLNLADQLQERI